MFDARNHLLDGNHSPRQILSILFIYKGSLGVGSTISQRFKDQVINLITERGHSVITVVENLGVSQHSILEWLKAVQPLRNHPNEHELLEAKREILRLKSQLKQTEEERDILK